MGHVRGVFTRNVRDSWEVAHECLNNGTRVHAQYASLSHAVCAPCLRLLPTRVDGSILARVRSDFHLCQPCEASRPVSKMFFSRSVSLCLSADESICASGDEWAGGGRGDGQRRDVAVASAGGGETRGRSAVRHGVAAGRSQGRRRSPDRSS